MSVKIFASFFVAALGGLLLYYTQSLAPKPTSATSNSFAASDIPRSQFSSKGMVNRVIQVQLTPQAVTSHADPNTIRATISMPFDFHGSLSYQWKLGEDVQLVEGDLSGTWSQLLKDSPKELHLVVTGFGKESNRHIKLEVLGERNGHHISGDSLIASDPESTFEDVVQNVEKIKGSK